MHGQNPVRVMHFIHSLKYGGAERQLAYLVQHSDPKIISHAVCCFNDDGREALDPFCELFVLDRKNRYDFKWREIYKLISGWEPDIVHNWLPNVLVNSFFPACKYRKSIYLNSYRSAVKLDSLYRIFQAFIYLFGETVISISAPEGLFFPFRQIYHLKDGRHIPIGIPVDSIRSAKPVLPPAIQPEPEQSLLLFVGRLSPEKNIPLLLRAMQGLSGEHPSLKLVLCGEGRDRLDLQRLTLELGIEDRVHFLGYREDVYSIMKACDLMVFPSFREGMGNVLFEALAAGLPAIASRIPSLEYWFKDREIVSLFNPNSLDEISNAIRKELLRSDREKELRREEAVQFVSGLNIDVMVQKTTALYLDLLQ